MNPFFSIIIPVYNVAPYLRECLDSVLAQTYEDWEAVCVDDGSTDGSGDILNEYARKDSRFRVLHQNNQGVCVARNVAIQNALGKYVCFLDGDDAFISHHLQVISDVIKTSGEVNWIRENKVLPWDSNCGDVREDISQLIRRIDSDKIFSWGWREVVSCGLLPLNVYRREALNGHLFPLGVRYSEDELHTLLMSANVKSACLVSVSGYRYRTNRPGCASLSYKYADGSVFIERLVQICDRIQTDNPQVRQELVSAFSALLFKDFNRLLVHQTVGTEEEAKRYMSLVRDVVRSCRFSPDGFKIHWRLAFQVFSQTGSLCLFRLLQVLIHIKVKVHQLRGCK